MASDRAVSVLDSGSFESVRFALGVSARALVVGALGYGLVDMLMLHRYASAFVLAGLACVTMLDLARHADKADRILSRFVDALAAGELEFPAPRAGGLSGLARLNQAIRRFHLDRAQARQRQQAEADYLRTLMDTVSAALVVVENDGITRLNRAAHKFSDQAALTRDVIDELKALRPGDRRVIRLGTGQRVLASAAQFFTADRATILLSLQNIESELDAAEIKAWQDLVRILSHEMMNSLTPIASLAQSVRPLLSNPTGQAHAEVAKAIDVIGDRSLGLMNFVERYRKVADLPRPVLRTVRIEDLLASIDRLYNPIFAENDIRYSISIDPQDMTIVADHELLEQALINIVRNAIEAVRETPSPTIAVSCVQESDQVIITIADNGHGAEVDVLERIFVPFFTTKLGGSGIGLSLVRQIVLAHGGQIEAIANADEGMTFRLLLNKSGVI